MSTRPLLGLSYTANLFRNKGYDVEAVFKEHGFSIENIDAAARISRSKELAIFQSLFDLHPDPLLALEVGPLLGPAGYGPLAMLLATCKNAYEAMQMGIRYQTLGYVFGDLSTELYNDKVALRIDQAIVPSKISEFILYRDMVGTAKMIKDIFQLNGFELELSSVEFASPRPSKAAGFEPAFNCPVKFSQQDNRIFIATKFLQLSFPQANVSAFNMYRDQCEKILFDSTQGQDSLSEALASYLAIFSYDIPKAAEAASTFGISERTLRRQLSAEGNSFQNVLDQVRFEKAKKWLSESGLAVEHIAAKLGYQEAAAFNHAFKRWSQTSPSHYRKTHSSK